MMPDDSSDSTSGRVASRWFTLSTFIFRSSLAATPCRDGATPAARGQQSQRKRTSAHARARTLQHSLLLQLLPRRPALHRSLHDHPRHLVLQRVRHRLQGSGDVRVVCVPAGGRERGRPWRAGGRTHRPAPRGSPAPQGPCGPPATGTPCAPPSCAPGSWRSQPAWRTARRWPRPRPPPPSSGWGVSRSPPPPSLRRRVSRVPPTPPPARANAASAGAGEGRTRTSGGGHVDTRSVNALRSGRGATLLARRLPLRLLLRRAPRTPPAAHFYLSRCLCGPSGPAALRIRRTTRRIFWCREIAPNSRQTCLRIQSHQSGHPC